MRKTFSFLLVCFAFLSFFACKQEQKDSSNKENNTILQKIANAYGLNEWQNVDKLRYTFNVDRDSSHFERSWEWSPKTGEIVYTTADTTIKYNRKKVAELPKIDADFINDKYWLLFPFQLVWDTGFEYEVKENQVAPISGKKLTQIWIKYRDESGYTPGDHYKIYIDKDFKIQEWEYFPKGSKEPRLQTTWQDYTQQNGILIAKNHFNQNKNFQLYFTDVKIE